MWDKVFKEEQAGILALTLLDGEPCLVCGSTSHPSPAKILSQGDIPTEQDIERKKQECEKQRIYKDGLYNELIKLNEANKSTFSTINEKLNQLAIDVTECQFNVDIKEKVKKCGKNIAAEIERIECAISQLDSLIARKNLLSQNKIATEKDFEQLSIDKEKFHQNFTIHSEREAKISTHINLILTDVPSWAVSKKDIVQRVHQISTQLETELNKFDNYSKEIEKLNNEYVAIKTKVNTLTKQLEDNQVKQEQGNFAAMLKTKNLSIENFSQYIRCVDKLDGIRLKLEAFNTETVRLQAKRDELEKQVGQLSYQNLDAIELQIVELDNQLKALGEKKEGVNQHKLSLTKVLDQLKKTVEKYQSTHDLFSMITEIGKVANGSNSHKISYENFVLGSYFEDIIIAGNKRLSKMTYGRFELRRKSDIGKGASQKGLDFEVFDQFTNKTRDAQTLSGGESFKASLALALGLSDIIQENAGGIILDTMFIDEGFGTLDPESLDNAIDTLVELQAGGRLIGVISHVEELKNRVNAKLEVRTSAMGSSTRFIV